MCPFPECVGREINEISKLVTQVTALLEGYRTVRSDSPQLVRNNIEDALELSYEAQQRLEAFFEADY